VPNPIAGLALHVILQWVLNGEARFLTHAKACATPVAILAAIPIPVPCADVTAGSVKTLQGQVLVLRGAETLPCREGMHILTTDALRTQSDGRVGMILRDGVRVSLGPNTEIRIDKSVYEPAEGQFGVLVRLLRGVMVFVSGKLGQFSPNSVQIETPVGMIGLRGALVAISLDQP
jgi:hypothetical protein